MRKFIYIELFVGTLLPTVLKSAMDKISGEGQLRLFCGPGREGEDEKAGLRAARVDRRMKKEM